MNIPSVGSIPPSIGGAIIGFFAVIIGHWFRFWLKQKSRRSKVRAGFLAEIETPEEVIDELADMESVTQSDVNYTTIPRDLYKSQGNEIGILSAEEVENIVEYYSLAAVAEEQINSISNGESVTHFDKTRTQLKVARDDAETVLNDHSKSKTRYICMLFE